MKKIHRISILLLLVCQILVAQNGKDEREFDITTATKLDGLEYQDGITFLLGNDKQTIIAIQNDKILWVKNVLKTCGKPKVGKVEIREVRIQKNALRLVYGKHDFAEIDIKSGKESCLGSD